MSSLVNPRRETEKRSGRNRYPLNLRGVSRLSAAEWRTSPRWHSARDRCPCLRNVTKGLPRKRGALLGIHYGATRSIIPLLISSHRYNNSRVEILVPVLSPLKMFTFASIQTLHRPVKIYFDNIACLSSFSLLFLSWIFHFADLTHRYTHFAETTNAKIYGIVTLTKKKVGI